MSQVHILCKIEEEDSGGRYEPDTYIKEVVGVYVDKDKAIADGNRLAGVPDAMVSDRYVNGVEQDVMYWTIGSWRAKVVYKLETQTLIDWE